MMGDWTFFSNHGHVLVCLARDGKARLRDVARDVGITERAVQKIVKDLQEGGYITVRKQGRCNRYRINRRKALRHGLESHCTTGKLLALVAPSGRIDALAEAIEKSAVSDATRSTPEDVPVETAPEAVPSPENAPQPETGTASDAKPDSGPTQKSEPESQPRSKPGSAPKPGDRNGSANSPLDVEQQGSLF